MKWLTTVLALSAAASGFVAVYYWYRSSKVTADPWGSEPPPSVMDPTLGLMKWMGAAIEAISLAGSLNKKASLWTAAAVALSAASTIVGIWA
jgi:hypothetical protein